MSSVSLSSILSCLKTVRNEKSVQITVELDPFLESSLR